MYAMCYVLMYQTLIILPPYPLPPNVCYILCIGVSYINLLPPYPLPPNVRYMPCINVLPPYPLPPIVCNMLCISVSYNKYFSSVSLITYCLYYTMHRCIIQ